MAEFTGERVIPDQVDPDLFNEHFARYAFASRLCGQKRVLDAGCGTGYGSYELAKRANSVTSVDVSAEAVRYAAEHYRGVRFVRASCTELPFAAASFDLVVSFEVIEHLPDWRPMLTEARRVLAPGGQFIVSTPNKSYYAESRRTSGPNPFHEHEFDFEEYRDELLMVFPQVSIVLQNHSDAIVFEPMAKGHGADVKVEACRSTADGSHFYVAVCSLSAQAGSPTFVYVPSSANVLRERELHIERLEQELSTKNAWLDEARREHRDLVQMFRAQKDDLEQRNEWARSLEADLKEREARIVALQDQLKPHEEKIASLEAQGRQLAAELAAKCDELAKCVQLLDAAELTVRERTEWALELDKQLKVLDLKLKIITQSRWFKLARAINSALRWKNPE